MENEMSDFECTPPELREAAVLVTEALLPEKSRHRYEKAYKAYRDWCSLKHVRDIASESVMLAYFSELARNKKASTLWSTYSMIRSTLNIREGVDISKFAKLLAYLKRQSVGYKAKKSSVFSRQDIDKFLKEAPLEFLLEKAILIIGVSGACRCDELLKMKVNDIDVMEKKITVMIPTTKTYQARAFVITDAEWLTPLKQYINLRKNIENDRFFLQFRFGKITKQPVGHNTIAQIPNKIAKYLKLKNVETFTGHAFRRTGATLLANSGGDVLQLKRLGGWKSSAVAEGYVESSSHGQEKIAQMLSTRIDVTAASTSTKEYNFSNDPLKGDLSFTINCHDNANVTINVNNLNSIDKVAPK